MKTVPLSEYILLTRDKRTAHIDLESPCECRKSSKDKQNNKRLFTLLCRLHGIENDILNRAKAGIHVCHLCTEKNCRNPRHAYIGTRSENWMDVPAQTRKEIALKRVAAIRVRGSGGSKRTRQRPRKPLARAEPDRREYMRYALSAMGFNEREIEAVLSTKPLPWLVDAVKNKGKFTYTDPYTDP